jgi:hypothetical protein
VLFGMALFRDVDNEVGIWLLGPILFGFFGGYLGDCFV